jgi:hypothetical protein
MMEAMPEGEMKEREIEERRTIESKVRQRYSRVVEIVVNAWYCNEVASGRVDVKVNGSEWES